MAKLTMQNKAKEKGLEKLGDILAINPIIKEIEESKRKKKMAKSGKPFYRCRIINGRPYWYLYQNIIVDGKRKQKIKYIGIRKPRREPPEDF